MGAIFVLVIGFLLLSLIGSGVQSDYYSKKNKYMNACCQLPKDKDEND